MTSPTDYCPDCRWVMDDMVNQFGKLIEGPAGHYEFCERHGQDASPTYEELQAENARLEDKLHYLTGDNYDLRMRAEELQGKLAASEETVRELHEAITAREKAIEEGNDPAVEQYDLMFALIATEPPNGASALAEVERLRGIIRDIRTAAPQNYQYMIKLCDDALSERSASPAEEQPRQPVSLDMCVCGSRYFEHVQFPKRDGVFCPNNWAAPFSPAEEQS